MLIVGGRKRENGKSFSQSAAELFDPVTRTFSLTGSLNVDRTDHSAIELASDQVLVTGGYRIVGDVGSGCVGPDELYDPTVGNFRPINSTLNGCHPETNHLTDGTVLITIDNPNAGIFRPETESYGFVGTLSQRRQNHTATTLSTGEVLVVGGSLNTGIWPKVPTLDTAEIYDPNSQTFKPIDALMNVSRVAHAATLLSDGHVLVVGGFTARKSLTGEIIGNLRLNSAELFIPSKR